MHGGISESPISAPLRSITLHPEGRRLPWAQRGRPRGWLQREGIASPGPEVSDCTPFLPPLLLSLPAKLLKPGCDPLWHPSEGTEWPGYDPLPPLCWKPSCSLSAWESHTARGWCVYWEGEASLPPPTFSWEDTDTIPKLWPSSHVNTCAFIHT